jgi:hypothetical protein
MSGFVQIATATGASSTSATISLTGVAAGNILLCFAKTQDGSLVESSFSFKDNANNPYVMIGGYFTATISSTMDVAIGYAGNGGSITVTVTKTGAAATWDLILAEYNGYTTLNSFKPANNGQTAGNSTSALSASLTPTSPDTNNLLIGWAFVEDATPRTFTAQSGWTVRGTVNSSMAIQDKTVSSNSAVTSTLTLNTATQWTAGIIAITDSAGFVTQPGFGATAIYPSLSSPPLGYGDENKFGSFGTIGRADVPFGNATPGSNTSGVGQIFPTGFGTP